MQEFGVNRSCTLGNNLQPGKSGMTADLLDDMRRCRTTQACIDLALTDTYGPEEAVAAWLACIETLFKRYKRVEVLGQTATLVGFDLSDGTVVAVCRQGKHKARVLLGSIGFPALTPLEKRWLQAWKNYSDQTG
jgi:hypothetical protein